ncbi:Lymphocyte-specific helicase [Frankliniella fusca]|uniref:Lymphocyte-specific helicase n=1 Tax=Frankliniella fusca TaxID=407009 RepID=A0AAE1LR21_9NEOP|nr:Lymphocyte-specific helicase [Frankliniella fusca]
MAPRRFTLKELSKFSDDVLKKMMKHMQQDDRKSNLQPSLVVGAVMRDYQLDGLEWLVALDQCGANGILADEMGLGKTLQVISLISFLLEEGDGNGDHFLVIAPLSTVQNWILEFKKFAPQVPVIRFHGSKEERLPMRYKILKRSKVNNKIKSFPVVITSYDTLLQDHFLRRINWRYIAIDEGQRLKNPQCLLLKELKKYTFSRCCILTGTPVQNNLTELWSLLNFLLPNKIPDLDEFLKWFDCSFLAEENFDVAEENSKLFNNLHKASFNKKENMHFIIVILKPFLLRRVKADVGLNLPPKKEIVVYATMTKWQERLYSAVVDRTLDLLQGKKRELECPKEIVRDIKRQKLTSGVESLNNEIEIERPTSRPRRQCVAQPGDYLLVQKGVSMETIRMVEHRNDCHDEVVTDKLLEGLVEPDEEFITDIKMGNPMQAMRLICSHPYTVSYPVMPGTRWFQIDERVVERSGKMKILDAMLKRLKSNGHKVLIFSVFTKMLDVIEDFVEMRGYRYTRLDGTRDIADRQENIEAFNSDDDIFVFLISTRAGGLGINLVAADTVILYDSDWNPQVDLQAQDRCHRIGQTKPVAIYRLIIKGSFDDHLLDVAERKKKLDKLVVQHGKFRNLRKTDIISVQELKELLEQAKNQNKIDPSTGLVYTNEELDALCDRAAVFDKDEKEWCPFAQSRNK